ncbi:MULTISPECIES: hypothetical protein [Nostoc]|uniref:Uncharacterized protein n=1 Tax=Nostoc paludosum FACHB-159 TaxID=2692908 RepID=A0ABR8K0J1_9NOSO|nr:MULTISPECIES: hypothetical protein [Nostoc]MBD2676216.1 hypothetical protein [Nostoc sp. FACHB-857]MBD2732655.1 hypothetical protein [Nostoc paludosum FACHB-159]
MGHGEQGSRGAEEQRRVFVQVLSPLPLCPSASCAPCPMPNAQCPMPNAQCPMPNTQCPMPNAQCPIPNNN